MWYNVNTTEREEAGMKLVIAIVQSADSGKLTDALVAQDFRCTRLNTVGGFLDEPNITMLVVTEDDQVDNLLTIIRQNCQARRRYMNAAPMSVETVGMPIVTAAPIEVEVGGAAVFVLPVLHFARLGATDPVPVSGMSGHQGVLLMAIVQADDANDVSAALVKEGYRLTRINTIGSFLRKGNATFLIGVQAGYVDKALDVMQEACRQRADPSPMKQGIPMYAITAFVLGTLPLPHLA
jgi:uncharacterized protein YaaQ